MGKCNAAALKKCALFDGINEEEITMLLECAHADVRKYGLGDTVTDFDGKRHEVGVVIAGEVELERIDYNGNRTVLEIIGEGDMFGQTLAFCNLTGDMLSVVCSKAAEVVFIPSDFVSGRCANICVKHNILVRNMLGIISDKAQTLSERVEVLSNRNIRDKLMCYFKLNCAKRRSNGFELPFSFSTLADYVCCDRSAMMREIAAMKSDGIVDIDKRDVRLL